MPLFLLLPFVLHIDGQKTTTRWWEMQTMTEGSWAPSGFLKPFTVEQCAVGLALLFFLLHRCFGALPSSLGREDPSLSLGSLPPHRQPALAVCRCTMARWEAEGCRGGLWCQSPTARARAGVALPDSSWATRTMRARPWMIAWGQTWSCMRTTKTQTRWEPYFLIHHTLITLILL